MFYSIRVPDLMLSSQGVTWQNLIKETEGYPEGNLLCMDTTYEGCKTRGELYMKKMIPIFTELCGEEYPVDNPVPVPFTKVSCKVKNKMYYYIHITDLVSCDVDTLIRCSSIHPSDTTKFACIDETREGCKAQLKEYITKIKCNLTTIYDGMEDPEEYAVCDGILEMPLEYEKYIYRVYNFTCPIVTYTKEEAIEEVKNRFTKLHVKIGKLLGKES